MVGLPNFSLDLLSLPGGGVVNTMICFILWIFWTNFVKSLCFVKHSPWSLYSRIFSFSFSSVSQSCPTLCDPMIHSTPGLPVHHQFPEFTQIRPSSQWCHPAISSSVIPFSSCPQSLPASESFPMSQLFTWGGQNIGVSALASVLPKNTQGWSPSEWTGWIPYSPRDSQESSPTPQFNSSALSFLHSPTHIHTWLL